MPEWFAIVLLGIIEGITEFLPISSTGHLLLAQHWLPRQTELFNVVIQCGAVLAVLLIFTERLKQMLFHWQEPATRDYVFKLFVSFFITAAGGLILKKLDFELPETVVPVASATLIGGVLFLVVEQWVRKRPMNEAISWRIAIAMGIAQLLAMVFPGTSRSGATILFALILGLSRPVAVEYSFLLGIPTLLSAGGYQIFKAMRDPLAPPENWSMVFLGSVVAAVTAFVVVKWLLRFVQSHTFVGFAWYRIALGLLLLVFVKEATSPHELPAPQGTNQTYLRPAQAPDGVIDLPGTNL